MSKKPNILFISCDQLRWDCLGFNDRYPVRTPNLDLFASESTCFDQAYTPLPTCSPARQALLCGQRPERFGALWNYDQGIPVGHIADDAYSWARSLTDAGYRNSWVGAWHVHPTLTPLDYGYQEFISSGDLASYQRKAHPELSFRKGFFGEVSPYPVEDSPTHRCAAEVIRIIDESGEGPWHVQMNFSEPHLPCRPSEPFASMYGSGDVPEWASFNDPFEGKPYIHRQMLLSWETDKLTWDDFRETVRLYYAWITQIDDAVGRVLRHLEERGLAEDTVVIFTADHGDMCGDRHMMDKHYVMYDEVTHVPLVVRYPRLGNAGRRCPAMVTNMLDIVPTILELAGCTVPSGLDGISLMPYLTGERVDSLRRYALVTYNGQQFGLFTQRMIRDDNWKYVWNPCDTDELYDMRNDPHELHNLSADPAYADVLAGLRRDLLRELTAVDDYTIKSGWLRDQLAKNRKV
ncbi:MAG: sulfatase-like hydrolase/transferase [Clostridia bacterium]|nr:sulfatase-like hydrolase/transferase [Clostridia bacterium]